MTNVILSVLQFMEKEKGILKEEMLSTICDSIKQAAEKSIYEGYNICVKFNQANGNINVFKIKKIVHTVIDKKQEISLNSAKNEENNPLAKIGDIIYIPINPNDLGRIVAQTARQAILQKIRIFEKDIIYKHYQKLLNEIVSGVVRRFDQGNIYIDLGKTEGILPYNERIPGENYLPGERIRCLLINIELTHKGPKIILSRKNINFITKLLSLEVTEINDNTVLIKKIVRDPGYKSKILVSSIDDKVDPVGACVGPKGNRIKMILKELGAERIDILYFYEDTELMLKEAIKPVTIKNINIDNAKNKILLEVNENDIKKILGKSGKNINLISQIIEMNIDVKKRNIDIDPVMNNFEEKKINAIKNINKIYNFTPEQSELLVNNGLNSYEAFTGVTEKDLQELGFTKKDSEEIIKNVKNCINK